ncbi:MAG: Flp family type IVb pilin [Rhodospirillales bacterium]
MANGLWGDEKGSTAIEYALIATFIFLVIIVALTVVGEDLSSLFNNISNDI